jgi:O-antigen/teichoic acid export membrane protein
VYLFWQQVRRFTTATAGLASVEGVSLVCGFALAIALGRSGGAELLGVFSAAFATVTIASLFIDLGFDIELARYIPVATPQNARTLFADVRTSKIWSWFIAAVGIICTLSLQQVTTENISLHGVLLITILFRCLNGSTAALLRAKNLQQHYIRFEIPSIIIEHVFSVALLLYTNASLAVVLLPFALASGIRYKLYNTITVRYATEIYSPLIWLNKKSIYTTIAMWKKGFALALTTVCSGVESRIGVVLLQHYCSSAEAGVYAAAIRFYNVLRIVPGALFQFLLPMFSARQSKYTEQAAALTTGGIIGVGGAIILYWLAEPVTILAFGEKFSQSTPLFSVLALRFLLLSIFMIVESYLLAYRHTIITLGILFFGMVFTVIGGIFLLPEHGSMGIVQLQTIVLLLQLCASILFAFYHRPSGKKQ